jgi:hypothetical protein
MAGDKIVGPHLSLLKVGFFRKKSLFQKVGCLNKGLSAATTINFLLGLQDY